MGAGGTKLKIMKKLFTMMAICLGAFTAANAQYTPEKGDFAVEFGFTPFNTRNGESFKLNEKMLKARWFISDKDALRLKLGLDINNRKDTYTDSYHPVNTKDETVYDQTTEVKTKTTSFSIMLGYERHLFTKGRFDVYAGLELGYLMNKQSGSWSEEYEATSYNSQNERSAYTKYDMSVDFSNAVDNGTAYAAGTGLTYAYSPSVAQNNFVANLFAGVDFYVYKQLYLGAEFGLKFRTGKTPNAYASGEINATSNAYTASTIVSTIYKETFDEDAGVSSVYQTVDGKVTTGMDGEPKYGNKVSNETKETVFKFFVEPAIRIGWTF